jgi:hypothetical protein
MLTSSLKNLHTAYNTLAQLPAVSAPVNKQLVVYKAEAINGSGGPIGVGILKTLSQVELDYYTVVDASSPKAVIAPLIKSGTPTQVFTTTANDGFMLQSNDRISMIGITTDVTSAAQGTITVKYYNGSTFTAVTPIAVPSALSAAGYKQWFIQVPHDWVPGTTAAVGGSSDKYSLLVTMGASLTNLVTATAVTAGQCLSYNKAVANNSVLSADFYGTIQKPLILNAGEGLAPYFATAHADNAVRVVYELPNN